MRILISLRLLFHGINRSIICVHLIVVGSILFLCGCDKESNTVTDNAATGGIKVVEIEPDQQVNYEVVVDKATSGNVALEDVAKVDNIVETPQDNEELTTVYDDGGVDSIDTTDDISKYVDDYRISMMDQIELNPCKPANAELVNMLDEIIPMITENCCSNTEKIRAIYDYLIDTCSYSDTIKYDYEADALILLQEHKGSCTYYVAAMHYMLLYIGIDNQIVNGYRYIEAGETSFHRWIEITLNGIQYIFDPQWEDSITLEKVGIQYEHFFKTHDEMRKYYSF